MDEAAAPAGLFDANVHDVETLEEFWLSGPMRDRTQADREVAGG